MGYLHINNLYKPEAQHILQFKTVYAMEKIHGTSAHIRWSHEMGPSFFSGGSKHEMFIGLFNHEELNAGFTALDIPDRTIVIYGESYGGKEQKMGATYGPIAKFVVFDVMVGDVWLTVPKAEKMAKQLKLEFVHYVEIATDLKLIDAERDADSVQAIRNGMGPGKLREGIVLRPLIEVNDNRGNRVICKHKRDEFKETKSPRTVDPAQLKILTDARDIADEWVTEMRLEHILQKIPDHSMEKMKSIISAMISDVSREGDGEFVESQAVKKAIGQKTAVMYKKYLRDKLDNSI